VTLRKTDSKIKRTAIAYIAMLVSYIFAEPVQRISKGDNIQNATLTADEVLNNSASGTHFRVIVCINYIFKKLRKSWFRPTLHNESYRTFRSK